MDVAEWYKTLRDAYPNCKALLMERIDKGDKEALEVLFILELGKTLGRKDMFETMHRRKKERRIEILQARGEAQ